MQTADFIYDWDWPPEIQRVGFLKKLPKLSCPCCIPNVSITWCFPRFSNLCMLLSCCVHVALQNVSRIWCFPRFLRMMLSYCVHAVFQNVPRTWCHPVFVDDCACCFHIVSMLLSKTIQEPFVVPDFCACCFHVVSIRKVSRTWCFPMLLRTKVFEDVAVMLCSCCFPKRFKNPVFSQVFVYDWAYCLNIVSILLSKIFQEPDVFPGFCAWLRMLLSCCVHLSFPNVSRTWCFPRFLCILLSCCAHVTFQTISRTWCFPRFLCMLLSCCVHVAFQKVSRIWCFPTYLWMLFSYPCYFPKCFKNLVFSQIFVHVVFMLCPYYIPKHF